MNMFSLLIGCAAGLFAVSHALALVSVFDYHLFLFPFGLAWVGYALAAGLLRTPLRPAIETKVLGASPVLAGLAMLASVGLYRVAPAMGGAALFFGGLVTLQVAVHGLAALALLREGRPFASACGVAAGLVLGWVFVAYLHADPLLAVLGASLLLLALPLGRLFGRAASVVYVLMACLVGGVLYQSVQHHVMPTALGWRLDPGKLAPAHPEGMRLAKEIWGRAGLSQLYALGSDAGAAWLFTNATAPTLVLHDTPARYGDEWWAQKAPLAMAIHDAVQPGSIVDVGMAPSDVAWRALGRGGAQRIHGIYASWDWTHLPVPGLEEMGRKVRTAPQNTLVEPVDMVVVTAGHAGQAGWVSSNRGEQTFLAREDILRYWEALNADGVLVFFARQETVFLRQLFSAWAALNHAGLSDTEFLDRAWAMVTETQADYSPYRYALVLTKDAKDPRFAGAIRSQVMKLPVRYLFAAGLPPRSPYQVLYQNERDRAQAIFTLAASRMYQKHVTLEPFTSFRAIPYRFSLEVAPQYKVLLVLTVVALLGIILLPLRASRHLDEIRVMHGPGVAVWLAAGGAFGAALVVAMAFLLVYPSSLAQASGVTVVAAMLVVVAAVRALARQEIRAMRLLAVSALVVVLVLMLSWVFGAVDVMRGDGAFYAVAAGGLLGLAGLALWQMHCALRHEPIGGLARWTWFAAASCAALALLWAARLYSMMGSGLLLAACVLWLGAAGVLWWQGRALTRSPAHGAI